MPESPAPKAGKSQSEPEPRIREALGPWFSSCSLPGLRGFLHGVRGGAQQEPPGERAQERERHQMFRLKSNSGRKSLMAVKSLFFSTDALRIGIT